PIVCSSERNPVGCFGHSHAISPSWLKTISCPSAIACRTTRCASVSLFIATSCCRGGGDQPKMLATGVLPSTSLTTQFAIFVHDGLALDRFAADRAGEAVPIIIIVVLLRLACREGGEDAVLCLLHYPPVETVLY